MRQVIYEAQPDGVVWSAIIFFLVVAGIIIIRWINGDKK